MHRLRRRSQGNWAGARDCTGWVYDIVIAGFDAVRLWYECECGRGDALELLLKCNRRDVVDLETVIELNEIEILGLHTKTFFGISVKTIMHHIIVTLWALWRYYYLLPYNRIMGLCHYLAFFFNHLLQIHCRSEECILRFSEELAIKVNG